MLDILNIIIYSVTVIMFLAVLLYAIGSKAQFRATLAERQQISDGSILLTFLIPKNIKTLQLKIGQQIILKTKNSIKINGVGKKFTPIQNSVGSFKILIVPSMHQITNSSTQEEKILKQLRQLKKGQQIYVSIGKSNFEYVGASVIKLIDSEKKVTMKRYKNLYIVAQGSKIPIAFQICKGICQDKSVAKPDITVLFVGGQIADFGLKTQFEHLEENYDNLSYFYSIPVKGERQPSVAGLGISSEKVAESFSTEIQSTFCILCAEENQLIVTAQRALMNKGVPSNQIYKY